MGKMEKDHRYPERKIIRLRSYNYNTQGTYFLTLCAEKRAPIFGRVVGGGVLDAPQVELSKIGKIIKEHILTLDSLEYAEVERWVIMPNHLHLLITVHERNGTSRTPSPTNTTIPQIVSTFKRLINQRIGFSVFQRSYYDHIVRNEEDYLRIREYIDNNPARWKEDQYFSS